MELSDGADCAIDGTLELPVDEDNVAGRAGTGGTGAEAGIGTAVIVIAVVAGVDDVAVEKNTSRRGS